MGKGSDRNKPCPCGSGKKYKNCCLNITLDKTPAKHSEIPLFNYHQVLFAYLENDKHSELMRHRDIPTSSILRRFFTL